MQNSKRNVITIWLNFGGIVLFVISTISALFFFFVSNGSNFDMAIILFVVGLASLLLFFGISEIINLLIKIENKLGKG